jgi:hypothetical protein
VDVVVLRLLGSFLAAQVGLGAEGDTWYPLPFTIENWRNLGLEKAFEIRQGLLGVYQECQGLDLLVLLGLDCF